jgi:hypothetical protein
MNTVKVLLLIALFFVIFSGSYAGVCSVRAYDAAEYGRVETFVSESAPPGAEGAVQVGDYGLLAGPDAVFAPIDTFSQSPGSAECESFGLMNTTGYLCLNETQRRLVGSRGGNCT